MEIENTHCQKAPSQMANFEKLEFNEILKILSAYCKTYIGKDICLNLMPNSSKETVQMLLNETR